MSTTKYRKLTVKMLGIERLKNSANGNPRFAITWARESDDGLVTRQTASNAAIGYEIGNPGYRVGDSVVITLTNAERIIFMSAAQ